MSAYLKSKSMLPRRPILFRHAPPGSVRVTAPIFKSSLAAMRADSLVIADLMQGPLVSSPKRIDQKLEPSFAAGVATMENTRHMATEDRVIQLLNINNTGVSLFGVVDGHGGADCATFVARELPHVIEMEAALRIGSSDTLLSESWGSLLEDAFRIVADNWDAQGILTSGAVATLVLVSNRSCLIAHVGDCKVIASLSDNSFVELTRDHRCSDPDEVERIEEAGGVVFNGRVEGRLLPSRAFGDLNVRTRANGDLLDCIAPEPDICYHHIDEESDGFLVVASDGLFDAVPCAKAVVHVRRALRDTGDPEYAAKQLVALAAKRTTDDVSVVVLAFRKGSPIDG